MNGRIVVVDDVPASFADLVVDTYRQRTSGRFAIAFSGGGTARECYARLARASEQIDWSSVDAWWGDERCVPLDDPDSNHHLTHDALLDHVGPLGSDHPMICGDGGISYERELRSCPPIDLVHLGLGPDGHTASLFPGSDALTAPPDRLVVENVDPTGSNVHRRMTFTYAAIASARRVVVTVSGAAKGDALRRVIDGDVTAPASSVRSDDLLWLVDAPAWDGAGGR